MVDKAHVCMLPLNSEDETYYHYFVQYVMAIVH